MPWAAPPSTCDSASAGLMMLPQSVAATKSTIRTWPVSSSTSTSTAWAPKL